MLNKNLVIASDHAGFELKKSLLGILKDWNYKVIDLGTANGSDRVDYPDYAQLLTETIRNGQASRGILVCGTGIGMSIAANRDPAVRAAVVWDVTTARLARQHNDVNVIALGARILGPEVAIDCVLTFLETGFEGGRHAARVAKLSKINHVND